MAERKKRKTTSTVKKRAPRTKAKAKVKAKTKTKAKAKTKIQDAGTKTRVGPDRSFAKVLQSKSVDTILPEVANRFEAGRRLYTQEAVAAATAELAVLNKERERLAEEEEAEGPAQVRIESLVTAVGTDITSGQELLEEMKLVIAPERGGWSVMGRVTMRDGTVPEKAAIVFLDENNEPVKELRPIKVGTDGVVRYAFSANVVKRQQARGGKVTVAVQVGRRIVATDSSPVRLKPGAMYQFDFRVNTGMG